MAEYQLTISRSAAKEFEKLPSNVIERVRAKIRSLASTPRPYGAKKLRSSGNVWRIRVGDWRILYEVDGLLISLRSVIGAKHTSE